jgi:FkbM family methyltransferase
MALRSQGGNGAAIIVEPDERSARVFEEVAATMGLKNVSVVSCGAWHKSDTLNLYVDPSHPATNFTDGCTDYDEDRRADFQSVTVPVDTLDNIVSNLGVDRVDLVSITTNGAEPEILMGMDKIIAGGLKYICLAGTGSGYDELVSRLGFDFLSHDDRGYTYVRRA